jgi:formate dehydrogenase iron-sulfur subunit
MWPTTYGAQRREKEPAVYGKGIEMAPDGDKVRTLAWPDSYGEEARPRMGFFTDTSICIGCKACEVACKEWNDIPEDGLEFLGNSYDNTGDLGSDTWRHVAFIEQEKPMQMDSEAGGMRWLMASDVCKHCTHAACLEVCPTGSLFRTEFGTVVVQQDICNGCGYCVPAWSLRGARPAVR